MCIIIVKPSGVELPWAMVKRCFHNNPDGAGFMYVKDGQVIGHKGFMEIRALKSAAIEHSLILGDKIHKDCSVVIHCRISTHGSVIPEHTHPFPVSNNIGKLNAKQWKSRAGVAHNGTIAGFTQNKDKSDTMMFIESYLGNKQLARIIYNHALLNLVQASVGGNNRLAILDNTNTVHLIGDYYQYEGVYYSNIGFSSKKVRTYTHASCSTTSSTERYSQEHFRARPWYMSKQDLDDGFVGKGFLSNTSYDLCKTGCKLAPKPYGAESVFHYLKNPCLICHLAVIDDSPISYHYDRTINKRAVIKCLAHKQIGYVDLNAKESAARQHHQETVRDKVYDIHQESVGAGGYRGGV